MLFSLSLGDGGVMKIASHNKFTNAIFREALIIASCDLVMNIMTGLTFYACIGLLASKFINKI